MPRGLTVSNVTQTADAEHQYTCPLASVDRRLNDVHRQWHEAEAAYFDPDAFRVAIQTVIQSLRTVTFILQSNKRLIPEFETWYQEWRERLGADPLMRWMVDARNKIEKQGDLEARSMVRAEIVASYLNEGPAIEVPADLFQAPSKLLKSIPRSDLGEHILKNGALRIERRWVENTLPDHELLDAVAIAYGKIAELVHDAHRQMGLPPPTTTNTKTGEEFAGGRDGRMPCMIAHCDRRALMLSLSDGSRLTAERRHIPFEEKEGKVAIERYGLTAEGVFGNSDDIEVQLRTLFQTARTMTEKDGGHITIVFLYRHAKLAGVMPLAFESQRDKYLIMREVANEAARKGADAAILISESWGAVADPEKPYMRASEAKDREELLTATMVRKNGEPLHLSAKFQREGKALKLGETEELRGGAHFDFAPLYEVWGKTIPDSWMRWVQDTPSVRKD